MVLDKEIRRQEENYSALFYLSLSFVQVLGAMRPGVLTGICTGGQQHSMAADCPVKCLLDVLSSFLNI